MYMYNILIYMNIFKFTMIFALRVFKVNFITINTDKLFIKKRLKLYLYNTFLFSIFCDVRFVFNFKTK